MDVVLYCPCPITIVLSLYTVYYDYTVYLIFEVVKSCSEIVIS